MSLRYLFLDMNSYFAAVEQQIRPELRQRPVAVVPVLAETTCCIAASYEAKRFGIRTGTPVHAARRLCPGLHVVEANPHLYITMHKRLIRSVETCLPVQAVRSIDELVCQLTGDKQQPDVAVRLAGQVKAAIRRDLGEYLRCSIGLAPNQFLAKVAADMHKPDGLTLLRLQDLPDRLYALPLRDLPGVGPRMERRLRQSGIAEVRQLCQLSAQQLTRIWGSRQLGKVWWHQLRGDDLPEAPTRRHTVGHSHVLPPEQRNDADARAVLLRLVEKAAARLRYIQYCADTISVLIGFLQAPAWQGRMTLSSCQDTLTLIRAACLLWQRKPSGVPLHVGVVLSDLTASRNVARPLFEEDGRLLALSRVMDQVNQRYGAHAVYLAGMHSARGHAPTRIAFTQIPDLRLADA